MISSVLKDIHCFLSWCIKATGTSQCLGFLLPSFEFWNIFSLKLKPDLRNSLLWTHSTIRRSVCFSWQKLLPRFVFKHPPHCFCSPCRHHSAHWHVTLRSWRHDFQGLTSCTGEPLIALCCLISDFIVGSKFFGVAFQRKYQQYRPKLLSSKRRVCSYKLDAAMKRYSISVRLHSSLTPFHTRCCVPYLPKQRQCCRFM